MAEEENDEVGQPAARIGGAPHLGWWISRGRALVHSHRVRLLAAILCGIVALYTVAGFFGVPLLIRGTGARHLSASLSRPVTVGRVAFNPYTLRLRLEQLHIANRGGAGSFIDIGALGLQASWKSLVHLAPIIRELTIDRPTIHVIRTAADRFNFSDLMEKSPGAPPSKPLLFSVSNIRVNDGKVDFDDSVLHQHHTADHIQIGVPFLANLPADVEVFVQPMVAMTIDGSRLDVAGMAKPFAAMPESVLEVNLRRVDLARYASYLPATVPVKLTQGTLTTKLEVHFIRTTGGPHVRLAGTITLDGFDLRGRSNAPLVAFKHASVALSDVEPLANIATLGAVDIDGLSSNVVLNRGGTTNFTALTAGSGAPAKPPAAGPKTAPLDLSLQALTLSNSAVKFTDNTTPTPAVIDLQAINVALTNFGTGPQAAPAAFNAAARLGSGTLALKGTVDLRHTQAGAEVTLDQIDLPAFQPFAQPVIAGTIAAGKLGVHAKLTAGVGGGRFDVRVQPATVVLTGLELRPPSADSKPIQLARLEVAIGQLDLASHQVTVTDVRTDGLRVSVRRLHDGRLDLASFLRTSPSAAPQAVTNANKNALSAPPVKSSPLPPGRLAATGRPGAAASPSWQYRIESVAIENSDVGVEDEVPARPMKIALAPLNVKLKGLSSDFAKPFELAIEGTLAPRGSFKIDGNAALTPLKLELHVATRRLDLVPAYTYVASRLNATITGAALTMNGRLRMEAARGAFSGGYRGNVTLAGVHMRDKVTNDRFLRWDALNVNGIDAVLDSGRPPRVKIGEVALSDFYARVILNSNGKLNLRDITSSPQAAPTSLTRAEAAPAPHAAAPAATHPIKADIELGRIVVHGGNINYTDNFIKPNYTANLTDMAGTVGRFGTRSTKPADVTLQGAINGSAPIDIEGSLNPLAPMAFIDLKAKANGIELTNLTPYSTKYTGYPIVKGTLTMDVHYHLDQGQLTAENHILIDQLTFGDYVRSPHALNLPIALGVALLKNSRGQIDVSVPVSGSLNDPHFSFGAVLMSAFSNLILKAATAPFALLAAAVGAPHQRLDYIVFTPGLATLTPAATNRLSILAKALKDKPGLRLSISGRVDPNVDREGLRNAMVEQSVKKQKVKELRERGESVNFNEVTVAPDEYDKYLKLAYKAAKFPKPRNFLGLDKSLPPAEMKKLMLANTQVTDEDLKKLAGQRADAVRRYLSKQVDPARLSIVASKLSAKGIDDKDQTSRVDLAIE